MTENLHATVYDIPGWPSPPRLRDIPGRENSWSFVNVYADPRDVEGSRLAYDETGHLWINGSRPGTPEIPHDNGVNPGAIAYWTPAGIGLWIHPKSLRSLSSLSRLDMNPDDWMPVTEVARELPPFVKEGK
jgi:hypothetical protein